ncbi:hypothetical protein [Intestinimonas butyriciproducens]|uniref:hypothetical protein n=1 Tax=Intestinimonas butyriciproducens TaxID=1297617 RepID=UPI001897DADF|nr:hypothetical protein [Intestinimonas butyriciproducens]
MFLDYSKIEFDHSGKPETPELVLKTLSGETLGILSDAYNLKFNIKFSEPSEISFSVPIKSSGITNHLYDAVAGYKLIYTKNYGIYVIMCPETVADGISDVEEVRGYSLEKLLDSKRFFLDEGTFNFWNPSSPADSILGRMLERAQGWSAGYVSTGLIGRYRTFDSVDDYLLSFAYNTLSEKYRCVFVFDPYAMTISAYDADEERPSLPIYLSFENLVQQLTVEENSDELVTAIRPYGADELDIRSVNPTGTNWIYDLSYFIESGDIKGDLAEKWDAWQRSILNYQALYRGLVGMRASSTARLLTEQASLTDLRGELEDLTNQQSVTIQALAMEATSTGKDYQQQILDEINGKIAAKKSEISVKESVIKDIEDELNSDNPSSCSGQIKAITEMLAFTTYFTTEEQRSLSQYFIEQDITEATFVATDVDSSVSGSRYDYKNGSAVVSGATIQEIDFTTDFGKRMFTISGGAFSISGDLEVNGDVIRGTLETSDNGECVMSLYAGTITAGGKSSPSGMLTITGRLSALSTDVHEVEEDGITIYEGSALRFGLSSASLYLTTNVSDYQKYSVQMELFDYATAVLRDRATPTYEFSVDSANFLFAQEFTPFRKSLELGKSVYLRLNDKMVITPIIIEFELDFESREKFSLVFSSRFKRHDNVNTLKDMIETSYSTTRSFDARRYIYNQTVGQVSAVSKFMQSSLDAAVNSILAAANQSVIINGSGIHVGGDSKYQMRIIDSMIAMTDDNWATAKLAVGLFATEESGAYFGVNAEVIGGKLIVGNNLIIENQNDQGVMQFKVDASGAWLHNSTFVLQKDNGGCMILDPKYGLLAGTDGLFTTEGTTVLPSFLGSDGEVELERDGMPANTNFFIDSRDGSAYFRGNVYATDGVFNGTVYATDGKFTGEIQATKGTFSGTIKAATLDGRLVGGATGGALEGISLNIGDGNFIVDTGGNVSMAGSINLSGGTITWGQNGPVRYQFSTNGTSGWHETMTANDKYRRDSLDGGITWGQPYQFRGEDGKDGSDGSDATVPKYITETVISKGVIEAPQINATKFGIYPSSASTSGSLSLYGDFGGKQYEMFELSYFAGDDARVVFDSPANAFASWDFGQTYFNGQVDFSNATVYGITATFA